jgi:hypothetical protein
MATSTARIPATSRIGGDPGRPRSRTGVAGACLGLVVGLLLRVRSSPDVDLWLHLRIGDLLRSGAQFDRGSDPLAVLADREYVPTQWLAQMAMSALYEAGGMVGIQAVRLLLVLALGAAVLAGCRALAGPAPALFATALTMFGAAAAWGERPQLAGLVLLALTGALWWWASERSSVPWGVVPVAWLWSTLHGTWLLGVGVGVVLLTGGAFDRRWRGRTLLLVAGVPVASLFVAGLTPLGPDALLEPLRVSSVAGLTANEWQRPEADNPLLLVVLTAVVISLLGLVRSPRRRWTRALTVLAGAALAMWMVRTIAVGAVVIAPALAHGLESLVTRPSRAAGEPGDVPVSARPQVRAGREWPAWALAAALVVLLAGTHIATTDFGPPVTDRVSAAVAALPDDARLAVDGRAVGWAQWAHRDRRPVRDLRAEVYSVPVALAYEDFQDARPGWQDYAAAQGITAVLANRERPLDQALSGETAWTSVAEDPEFRLWVRR